MTSVQCYLIYSHLDSRHSSTMVQISCFSPQVKNLDYSVTAVAAAALRNRETLLYVSIVVLKYFLSFCEISEEAELASVSQSYHL